MTFELHTVSIRPDGCFSVLCYRDSPNWPARPFAVTCERTFDDGRPVIQAGIHHCKKTIFLRGDYPTFEIEVPGHSRVLFHRGNKETDSEACVLVAKSFALMDGQTAIADSKDGFAEFWELARPFDEFDLVVLGR